MLSKSEAKNERDRIISGIRMDQIANIIIQSMKKKHGDIKKGFVFLGYAKNVAT